VRLSDIQIIEAIAEWLVRHRHVQGGSAVNIRIKIIDGNGNRAFVITGDNKDPKFVADVTDYGVPVADSPCGVGRLR
jgi:hypothetical protein